MESSGGVPVRVQKYRIYPKICCVHLTILLHVLVLRLTLCEVLQVLKRVWRWGGAYREGVSPQASSFFLPSCSGGSRTIFSSQNNFALTNPEKSIHQESDTKETREEEELDTEILEVFHPTQEWQTLQPGTIFALLLRNTDLKPQMPLFLKVGSRHSHDDHHSGSCSAVGFGNLILQQSSVWCISARGGRSVLGGRAFWASDGKLCEA